MEGELSVIDYVATNSCLKMLYILSLMQIAGQDWLQVRFRDALVMWMENQAMLVSAIPRGLPWTTKGTFTLQILQISPFERLEKQVSEMLILLLLLLELESVTNV